MVDREISRRLENARSKGRASHLSRYSESSRTSPYREQPIHGVVRPNSSLFEALFGRDHAYTRNFTLQTTNQKVGQPYPGDVGEGLGVLEAASEDVARGWALHFKEVVHAELFDDFLKMASHQINNGGYRDAAAVLADGVLRVPFKTPAGGY
jgi:hypothetical protein